MNDLIEETLLGHLRGEGAIANEEADILQRNERLFYESLITDSDMTLSEGNRLVKVKGKRLWGVLKKKGYENLPHGIQVDLLREGEGIVVRLVLQCRYGKNMRGRHPSKDDLMRHSQLLNVSLIKEEEYHYKSESGKQVPEQMQERISEKKYENIELVFEHKMNVDEESKERQLSIILREALTRILPSYEAILEAAPAVLEAGVRVSEKLPEEEKGIHPKNIILQGPPGTGKTYHTILYAVSIIEGKTLETIKRDEYAKVKKRFDGYRDENRIAFTTFHQSYGYEEFIEGIKPVVNDSGEVGFNVESGIFKEFCELATTNHRISPSARIWKISLGGAGEREVKTKCFEDGTIRIGFTKHGETPLLEDEKMTSAMKNVFTYFYDTMEIGDVVLSLKDNEHIDGIGIIEGEAEWLGDEEKYKRCRKVKWLAKDISESILEMNMRKKMTQKTIYPLDRLTVSQIERIVAKHGAVEKDDEERSEPYVFIIDEINRGNISKILGELITLIEPSKRLGEVEETLVKLPYSKKEFGVPDNIHIIGTMNTADRSIALMDTALRRRFRFVEMSPDPSTLQGISVGGVDIERLLKVMNRRIEALYDRNHMIGHAYFTGLSSEDGMDALKEIFVKSIIPLLHEYFFDDHEKIRAVFGDDQRENGPHIMEKRLDVSELFGASMYLSDIYKVNLKALSSPEVYQAIYAGHHAEA